MNKAKWLGLSLATLFCLTVCDNRISNPKLYLSGSLGYITSDSIFIYTPDEYTYVGLNYSEADVFLVNTTKDSLITVFTEKDSTINVEWLLLYEDSSIDTIFIDPTKCSFHDFWYFMCTSPFHKLIVDGKSHAPINHLEHRIKIVKRIK